MRRLVLLIATVALACGCSEDPPMKPAASSSKRPRRAKLEVAGRTIDVELAYTPTATTQGLKHRTSLEPDSGMLFIFPTIEPRRFWMQDTLIDLDIMFLDDEGTILNIEHGQRGVEQPGYMSEGSARFVLEMAGGWSESVGLTAGTRVEISQELRDLAPLEG